MAYKVPQIEGKVRFFETLTKFFADGWHRQTIYVFDASPSRLRSARFETPSRNQSSFEALSTHLGMTRRTQNSSLDDVAACG